MLKIKLLSVFLFVILSTNAVAMTVYQYDKLKTQAGDDLRKKSLLKALVGNMGQGIFFANAELSEMKRDLLYCQPDKLAINPSTYQDILEREIKSTRELIPEIAPEIPIGILLVEGLKSTFPCE